MNKEYILCAAIKRINPKNVENPYEEGTNDILKIELGYRHHDIYTRFPDELDISPNAQGFYTSKGRFVNREEAFQIALKSGQLNGDNVYNIKLLCSENLY